MYADQGRSNQAKTLRTLLTSKGLTLSHAQCLEVIAKLEGHRTLHVAHAKQRTLVIHEVAKEQAIMVMFSDLGAYENRIDDLMADLARLPGLQDASEEDRLFRQIFRKPGKVVLEDAYQDLRADDIPGAFDQLVEKLRSVMLKKAEASDGYRQTLFEGTVADWRRTEGVLEEGDNPPDYHLTIVKAGSQFYLDLAPVDKIAGKPQLGLFFEVNDGLPCLHVRNDIDGDQALTVFGMSDGLYLRPATEELCIRGGTPPTGTDLRERHLQESKPPVGLKAVRNHAYLACSNRDD